jgi:hypothetical protein
MLTTANTEHELSIRTDILFTITILKTPTTTTNIGIQIKVLSTFFPAKKLKQQL